MRPRFDMSGPPGAPSPDETSASSGDERAPGLDHNDFKYSTRSHRSSSESAVPYS